MEIYLSLKFVFRKESRALVFVSPWETLVFESLNVLNVKFQSCNKNDVEFLVNGDAYETLAFPKRNTNA